MTFFFVLSLWFFYLTFDTFAYLNPKEVSWFEIDNTTAYIAQLFFVSDEWQFPLLRNPDYGDVLSTSPTFTGPSPVIVVLMKVFGINPELQFFGFWIFLNIFLQLYFGYRFLKVLGVSANYATFLTIFFVTPFLFIKLQGHFWLISHYLILWSLCIFFHYSQRRYFRKWEVTFLLCVSYLTNIYLLVMVMFVILLLFMFRLSAVTKNFRRVLNDFFLPLIILILVFSIFDGFDRQENLYQSVKMYLSPTYGYHGFNLLTFFNPDTGIVAEGGANIAENLPIFSIFQITLGMTPGAYEGFMYLGLGVLTILFSVILFRKRFIPLTIGEFEPRQKKVLVVLVSLLTLFAISYRIGIGPWSIVLPFPTYLDWLLGTFRSSGRFMWPLAYALIGMLIAKFYKTVMVKCNKIVSAFLVILVLLIQQIDITAPLLRQERVLKSTTNESDYRTNGFAEARQVLKPYRLIRAYPQGDVLANHYAELNYLAWTLGIRTDLHFTSRMNVSAMYKRERETFEDLCSGGLRRLTAYAVTNENKVDFAECTQNIEPIFKDQFHTYYGQLP